MENNPASTNSLEILEKLVEQKGPIFTIEDAYNVGLYFSLAPSQMTKALSKMSRSGWLARLKRETYLI